MVRQMTRAEYEKEFGVKPTVSTAPVTQEQKTPLVNKISNFFGAKGITEQFGADIAKTRATEEEKPFVEYPTFKEVAGSAIQTGANLIPGAGRGAGLVKKALTGAGAGATFDIGSQLQTDQPVELGTGTVVGAGLPVAGSLVKASTKIIGSLLKGTGSALSGAPAEVIEQIFENPNVALKTAKDIRKSGGVKILQENAKKIQEGFGKIKKEASEQFSKGLEELSEIDIKPIEFKTNISKTLDKYGVVKEGGKRSIRGVEFSDSKNTKKANELIDKLQTVELNGKSLRKLADDIESARYKIATSDERLSFNAFIDDLSESLKNAISSSTDKLDDINRAYSQDKQLIEAAQSVLGKSKFRNLKEILDTSKKLENLFAQKGLAPEVVDDFLTRVGISPEDFKGTEAMRQIASKGYGPNQIGANPFEIVRAFTSAVVSPNMVGQIAAKLGIANEIVKEMAEKLSPAARNVIINALLPRDPTQEPEGQ